MHLVRVLIGSLRCLPRVVISEFRISETARSWARIRDKKQLASVAIYGDTSEKAVPVEFVPTFFV